MAATSTNKQPLLVDRVLHYVVNLDNAINAQLDIIGINTAILLVDGTTSDGAILEDIYSIARADTAAETINLYLSSGSDYLRPGEGVLVGSFQSGSTAGEVTRWSEAPKILAPVPQAATGQDTTAGKPLQFQALYIPKGRALWAARQSSDVLTNGPLLGCQGGWY